MDELLSAIKEISSLNDLAQALADFFEGGQAASASFMQTATAVLRRAVDIAADLPGDSHKVRALDKAIEMYSGFGDFTSAQAVIERLPSGEGPIAGQKRIVGSPRSGPVSVSCQRLSALS